MSENIYVLGSDGELYHYGVKGMKWGIRRYQNPNGSLTPAGKKHVKMYRAKEIGKIEKRRAKEREVEQRWEERDMKRYEKKLAKYGEGDKANKALKNYNARKTASIYDEKLAKAEIDKLKNYKLSDISAEKKAIGRHIAAATIGNIGAVALGALGAPVIPVYTTNVQAVKTGMRVNTETQNRLLNKSTNEARLATRKLASASSNKNGFGEHTRVTGQQEADFWRGLAEEELKKRRGG